MPLHRNIHWIGRQWAVTGHGMQLIDQKLQGFFDIEIDRLWDEALIESVHAKDWLNTADFDKGLALARARFPQPSGAVTSPSVAKSVELKPEPPKLDTTKPAAPALTRPVEPPAAVTPLRQAAPAPVAAPPQIAKPVEPKPAKLEAPKPAAPVLARPAPVEPPRATPELKVSAVATPAPVEPPIAVAPPRQAAPTPAIETVAPLPVVTKPVQPKVKTLKLGAPEPVTVTFVKQRPAEPPGAAAVPAAPSASSVPVVTPEGSKPPSLFQMRYQCHARFVRPWRVVTKRPT